MSSEPPVDSPIDPLTDLAGYNRQAWGRLVRAGNQWTVPVSSETIEAARRGDWSIVLTPQQAVPADWFPDFSGGDCEVLCLAGSGGQQAPVLAAAGARVTVVDLSPDQLAQDRMVAQRDNLDLKTIEGDMRDLGMLESESFDLIVHPCSNSFVPNVNPVWREAARVLRPGGALISGFIQPVFHIFDADEMEQGRLRVAHSIPYSDLTSLSDERRQAYVEQGEPLIFGHSMTDLLSGQLQAGLAITGYYEDTWPEYVISEFIPCFAATRAIKR